MGRSCAVSVLPATHNILPAPVLCSEGGLPSSCRDLFLIQREDAACQSSSGRGSHCANSICQNSQKLWTCLPQCKEMHGCSGWKRGKQTRTAWEHGYYRAGDLRAKIGQGQEKGLHL